MPGKPALCPNQPRNKRLNSFVLLPAGLATLHATLTNLNSQCSPSGRRTSIKPTGRSGTLVTSGRNRIARPLACETLASNENSVSICGVSRCDFEYAAKRHSTNSSVIDSNAGRRSNGQSTVKRNRSSCNSNQRSLFCTASHRSIGHSRLHAALCWSEALRWSIACWPSNRSCCRTGCTNRGRIVGPGRRCEVRVTRGSRRPTA